MKKHPIRWDSLIFGVLFALAVAGWAMLDYDLVTLADLLIAIPVALILAGLAGFALTLKKAS